jgi:hypothetical protein
VSLSGGGDGTSPAADASTWATLVGKSLVRPLGTAQFNILCLPITALFDEGAATAVLGAARGACQSANAVSFEADQ